MMNNEKVAEEGRGMLDYVKILIEMEKDESIMAKLQEAKTQVEGLLCADAFMQTALKLKIDFQSPSMLEGIASLVGFQAMIWEGSKSQSEVFEKILERARHFSGFAEESPELRAALNRLQEKENSK